MEPSPLAVDAAEYAARTPQRFLQAPLRYLQIADAEPGELPYDVVFEEAVVRLRRYEPAAERGDPPAADRPDAPIVVVYPFINDPSILDFHPGRSVVGGFLAAGFTVYVLEWLDASPIDRSIGLADVVTRYVDRSVEVARRAAGVDAIHLLGYSVGAPLAAAYAGLRPERVRTLVLQGPPLDFDAGGGVGLLRTQAAHLDVERLADVLGTVPPSVVEGGFALRKPVEYALTNPLRLWDHLDDDEYVEDVGRKLAWARDGPDLPGTFFREFVRELLLENRLIRGELVLDGLDVDLGAVDVPVALFVGAEDAFVPREASVPFLEAVASEDTAVVEAPVGHVGLSIAPEAHEEGWPRIREWLLERS